MKCHQNSHWTTDGERNWEETDSILKGSGLLGIWELYMAN